MNPRPSDLQSDALTLPHTTRFKGDTGETSERPGGAHNMGLFERIDTVLNSAELSSILSEDKFVSRYNVFCIVHSVSSRPSPS